MPVKYAQEAKKARRSLRFRNSKGTPASPVTASRGKIRPHGQVEKLTRICGCTRKVMTAMVTGITFRVQPQILVNFSTWPWGLIFPLLAVTALAGVPFELRKRSERRAFFASCAYLTGMLTSVVFGVYPMVLPARNPLYSLTVSNAEAGNYGLRVGLVWWVPGMILAAGYFTFVYRSFAGKVALDKDSHGHGD